MSARNKLEQQVAALGGSIDWDSSNITRKDKLLFIDAPDGYIWDWSESETLTVCWFSGAAEEFYAEALEQISYGCQEH
jgi:hypothetical protein